MVLLNGVTRPTVEKLDQLRALLQQMKSVLICYSGGIDSALVLAVANEQLGSRAVGMTAVSPSLPRSEKDDAAGFANLIAARHYFVNTNEIERPGYVKNGPDRCFHCKSELYEVAEAKRRELGIDVIVNGTNLDDLGDYRPGLAAAADAGVRSPLVETRFHKSDVRLAAQALNLPIWDKPASACLSSRIPYGASVTRERLAQIGDFEAQLKQLGFRQLRVRWHDQIARIEVDLMELPRLLEDPVRQRVVAIGKDCGFAYVTIDLAGYRTGSHNEVLAGRSLRIV